MVKILDKHRLFWKIMSCVVTDPPNGVWTHNRGCNIYLGKKFMSLNLDFNWYENKFRF